MPFLFGFCHLGSKHGFELLEYGLGFGKTAVSVLEFVAHPLKLVVGGGEGEVRFGPNFGFFLRGLYRQAETNQVTIDDGTGLDPVRYDIDFNGPAVNFGPRWYFGGLEGPPAAPAPAPTPVPAPTPAPADSL